MEEEINECPKCGGELGLTHSMSLVGDRPNNNSSSAMKVFCCEKCKRVFDETELNFESFDN